MAEYIEREKLIDWFRPYGHMDERISFESLVSETRDMVVADVAPVVHGRWIEGAVWFDFQYYDCSVCDRSVRVTDTEALEDYPYCHCGAKMDLEVPGEDH